MVWFYYITHARNVAPFPPYWEGFKEAARVQRSRPEAVSVGQHGLAGTMRASSSAARCWIRQPSWRPRSCMRCVTWLPGCWITATIRRMAPPSGAGLRAPPLPFPTSPSRAATTTPCMRRTSGAALTQSARPSSRLSRPRRTFKMI